MAVAAWAYACMGNDSTLIAEICPKNGRTIRQHIER